MSTQDTRTTTTGHYDWCQVTRCVSDPIDGTTVHVSAAGDYALSNADVAASFWQADGETMRVELELSPELMDADGVDELITVLQSVRDAMRAEVTR